MAKPYNRAIKRLQARIKQYDALSQSEKDTRKRPGSMNRRKQA